MINGATNTVCAEPPTKRANRRAPWLIIALLAPGVACGTQEEAAAETTIESTELLIDGRITPRDATELQAPQNTFQVGNWRSWGGWIKLVHFVKDGKEVKEGDVVARFAFDYDQAQSYVQREIARAEADSERSRLDQEAKLRQLTTELGQRDLDVQRAALNLRQAGVIAQRTFKAFELDHEMTEFEANAIRQRIAAQERAMAAEARYHELSRARAQQMQEQFDGYKGRYQLVAPHDGVVRHGYHRRRRRKIQKGDGMPAGMTVLSIARGDELSIEAFVPEHLIGRIEVGKEIEVLGLDDEEYTAAVKVIDPVPQELGFLRNDEKLPNAREKAFRVFADFVGDTEGLTAGNDVKVRMP